MSDASQKLLERIQHKVYKKQSGVLRKLKGKYVVRNGVTFLVVAARKDAVIVSDVKTPVGQVSKMSARSFLGKKVTPADEGE